MCEMTFKTLYLNYTTVYKQHLYESIKWRNIIGFKVPMLADI